MTITAVIGTEFYISDLLNFNELSLAFILDHMYVFYDNHLSWSCWWGYLRCSVSVVKHEVVGVVGSSVSIPCNCTPSYSHTQDSPVLILWYKDKAKLPIYRSVPALISSSFIFKENLILASETFKHFFRNLTFPNINWGIPDLTC